MMFDVKQLSLESQKVIAFADHEEYSKVPSPERLVLTGNRLLFLGAIAGSLGTFWSYKMLSGWLSLTFPMPTMLAGLVIGALCGIGITSIADERRRLRWIALAAAFFIGMWVAFVSYLILSFLAGPT